MHGHPPWRSNLAADENISGTILDFRAAAKPRVWTESAHAAVGDWHEGRCAYIAADHWPPGAPPFCGAPVLIGSPYCAQHTRLCIADPRSVEGAQIVLMQERAADAVPPPELATLTPVAVPEPSDDDTVDARELPIDTRQEQITEEQA